MNIQQKCLCAHQNTRKVAKTPQSGPHASDRVGPVQRGEAQPRRRQNGAGEVSLRETAGDSHTNHTRRGTRMPEEQGHCNKVREGLASEHLGMGWVVCWYRNLKTKFLNILVSLFPQYQGYLFTPYIYTIKKKY